ncbi:MAG: c-type cytochrome [Cyclobacteriaceae bacterium]|nr:c-type cytochrome [Cyclobacteriaceae bacterium]
MKKTVRIAGYALLTIVIGLSILIAYVSIFLPDVGDAPDIKIEITQDKVERGKYLANHVMLCMDCHAERDFSLFAGPPIPGTLGAGGERFDHSMNFPGIFISQNITPSGIADWTDGELYRLITTGVRKDGKPIFPVMPYLSYGQLDPADIEAVIAYIRTLDPVQTSHPKSKADFPVNLVLNTMPKKAQPGKRPDKTDLISYGKYLTTAAACADCHTKMVDGKQVGKPFAGGFEFAFPDGRILQSANITPHETGIGTWTKEQFIQRFKIYAEDHYKPHPVGEDELQTVMPWLMYAGMDEYDLGAIYAYLKTLTPVNNKVTTLTFKQ